MEQGWTPAFILRFWGNPRIIPALKGSPGNLSFIPVGPKAQSLVRGSGGLPPGGGSGRSP